MVARDGAKAEWKKMIQSMSVDGLRQRWFDDFGNLHGDVSQISRNREVFEALDSEIVHRQHAGRGFFLTEFLRPMYVQTQAVLVRRLGDTDPRSKSLRMLLDEMILRPEVLTREWFVDRWAAHYSGDDDELQMGDLEFSNDFGESEQHVPIGVLNRYRSELDADQKAVKTFVDKYVAHQDRDRPEPIRWNDLHGSIDRLDHHLNAVGRIVVGSSIAITATSGDWRDVFRAGLFTNQA
jgi:hypothetical protein